MTTPILTKKQQRQSLSGKKGPTKGLRNILTQPFENYWPVVNLDQYPTLVNLLNELLPLLKRPRFKIPGSMLRHMTKEKRLLAKKEELEKETAKLSLNMNILKSVILGINANTRALEKNNICCVLLDANIEPPLLVKHVVIMAQNKKVPVLLLPVLKAVTLETIGFAVAAVGLKHDVMNTDNAFHALYKQVLEVFKDFEPPKCPLRLFNEETSEESEMCETKVTTGTDWDPTPQSSTSKPEKSGTVFTDLYRYRSSREERAFIPPSSNKDSKVTQASTDEFIALSDDVDNFKPHIPKNKRYMDIHKDASKNVEKNSNKSYDGSKLVNDDMELSECTGNFIMPRKHKSDITYMSLKVKRIRGNDNRLKATKVVKKKKK